MSIQGSNTDVKGKRVKGTGSILANLDAKARRAFAKRANKIDKQKREKAQQRAQDKELDKIHQKIAKREQQKKVGAKPLSYWLLSASIAEIWRRLFSSGNHQH